jgi:hypothetical protein
MDFVEFRDELRQHVSGMLSGVDHLFVVEADKDVLYNLYLDSFPAGANALTQHRRVFEALGGMIRVEDTDDQLSGVGFSSTQRNSVIAKITGAVSRTVKIIF